jgi:peptidoglycan/LPS O-acetylase OafA/YrhL
MAGHLVGTQGYPITLDWYRLIFPSAHMGVKTFFVISGFLITYLLIREQRKYGSILLKRFFFRRILRIWPAFFGYVAFVAIFAALGWVVLKQGDLLHASTFTMNYHWVRGWPLGHIWSLSVVEQFYFLWPAVLALFGVRAGIRGAAAYVLVAPLVRVGIWYYFPDLRVGVAESFETVADNLAIGCILAATRDQLWAREGWRKFILSPWFVVVPLIVYASDHLEGFPSYGYPLGHSIENIGLALCLEWCLRNYPKRAFPRFVNHRILTAVGRMSYSLYLWQQMFLNRSAKSLLCAFPQNLLLAFAVASIAYWCRERHCMKIRPYLASRMGMIRTVPVNGIDSVGTRRTIVSRTP